MTDFICTPNLCFGSLLLFGLIVPTFWLVQILVIVVAITALVMVNRMMNRQQRALLQVVDDSKASLELLDEVHKCMKDHLNRLYVQLENDSTRIMELITAHDEHIRMENEERKATRKKNKEQFGIEDTSIHIITTGDQKDGTQEAD